MSHQFKYLNVQYLSLLGVVCILSGLLLSRALISIGMVIMILPILNPATLKKVIQNYFKSPVYMGFLAFVLLVLISGIYSSDQESFWRHFRVKLPFIGLPLAFAALPKLEKKVYLSLLYFFFLLTTGFALYSAGILISDVKGSLEAIHLGQVPYTPIHHIRYSLMLVVAFVIGYILFSEKHYWVHKAERWLIISLMLFLFVYIHVLSVRSGWLALYLIIAVLLFRHIFISKKYLLGLGIILALSAMPLVAYQTIPTFRSKIGYMKYDLQQFAEGKNEGQNNDTRRLRSINAGIQLGNENFLSGVGLGDVEHDSSIKYAELYPDSRPENQISPHNQFIFIYAGMGIIGLLSLLFMSFAPLFYHKGYQNILLLSTVVIVLSSYLTEHTIEVQIGVGFYLVFLLLGINQLPEKKSTLA